LLCRFILFCQNRIDYIIKTLAFDPACLAKAAFALHAQFLHHPVRCMVIGMTDGEHAVGIQVGEGQLQQGAGSLSRKALTPEVRMDTPADLPLMDGSTNLDQRKLPDDRIAGRDDQPQDVTDARHNFLGLDVFV
jgi:hypothetical protein